MASIRDHLIRALTDLTRSAPAAFEQHSTKRLAKLLAHSARLERLHSTIHRETASLSYDEYEDRIEDLEKTVEDFRACNERQAESIKALLAQIADLQTENRSLRIQSREHSASAERLAADLLNCSVDAGKTISRLKQDNATLTEQNTHLRSEYDRIHDMLVHHILANPGSFL